MIGAPLAGEARRPRKNVMLAAMITAGAVSAPVRIRNLSEIGAMIDGPALPEAGSSLTLSRLALSIDATVVWNRGGRCGLNLGCPIVVDDWIAGASKAPAGHGAGQFRVDQVQRAIRSGAGLPADLQPPPDRPVHARQIERNMAAELGRLKVMLERVGEQLGDDVALLQRHQLALQSIDIAGTILGELATVLRADDREGAVGAVRMHELRGRLSGRLTLT
jgi:hypothetical protein